MVRPRADLPAQAELRALVDCDGRLALRVTPGADRDALVISDDRLLARVRAVPESGKANQAVIALVAKALNVPRKAITVLRGATAREKMLKIDD